MLPYAVRASRVAGLLAAALAIGCATSPYQGMASQELCTRYLSVPSGAPADDELRQELARRNETCGAYNGLLERKRGVDEAYRQGLEEFARQTESQGKTVELPVNGRRVRCTAEGLYTTCP